jgi:hypothetical protein
MIKFVRFALVAFAAIVYAVFVFPSRQADPPEPDCASDAPCAEPQLIALPQDGPDGNSDVGPPPASDIIAASGPAALLPPLGWLNDDTMTPPRSQPRRPHLQSSDDGWLAYAAGAR